tara:strand:+ start:8270 stop:13954 length:5685 start_codon:yes stop_codon:yes gene_type:complete
MATCYNRNTGEYKALLNRFNNRNLVVDSLISRWQKTFNSDILPTVSQADTFLNQQKTNLNLKRKTYSDAILANLYNAGLVHKLNGEYFINVTKPGISKNIKSIDQLVIDPKQAQINKIKVENKLSFWGISPESYQIEKTENTFRISMNPMVFSRQDIIAQENNKDHTHILDIMGHMNSMFPQLKINFVSVKEAKAYYDNQPMYETRGIGFNNVNSYYHKGQVFLIKGRVTKEMAVEEVLHPFIDAIYTENRSLFDGLLAEAKEMFPQLDMEINSAYTNRRGFVKKDRDQELVTQAMSRHFNKEYENNPTTSWRTKVSQFLKFFLDVINDLAVFLTGKKLSFNNTAMLNSDNTLSSIAKLLNSDDLQFKFTRENVTDNKFKFSLTKARETARKHLLSQANPVQKKLINKLFKHAITNKKKFKDFTIGSTDQGLVILRQEDKKKGITRAYVDVLNFDESGKPMEYESVTTKIKGKLNDPGDLYKINREIGNDFDTIMEYVTTVGENQNILRTLVPKMKVLKSDQVQRAIDQIQTVLTMYRDQGAVIIPQVVISDSASSTAGTIDLLVIHKNGSMQIIDLKVSKNNHLDKAYTNTKYDVQKESVFFDSANPKKRIITTQTQHSIQISAYARILANMGYNVMAESRILHFLVDLTGESKNQKLTGFRFNGASNHYASQNASKVDQIVKVNVDAFNKEENDIDAESNPMSNNLLRPQQDYIDTDGYKILDGTTQAYKGKMITRKEALETLQDKQKMTLDVQNMINNIDRQISDINVATNRGQVDVVYQELLESALKDMEDFIEFVNDPSQINKTEYIDRLLTMENIVKTYKQLNVVDNPTGVPLGQNIESLRNKLMDRADQILGDNKYARKGLINGGIINYVTELYRTNTNRTDLSDKDIENIITGIHDPIEDINSLTYGAMDLATSRDPLSALLDKIYKRQVQKVLDEQEQRADLIRRSATKLENLSPGGKVDFKFMLLMDEKGKFTGRYVQKIGSKYRNQWWAIRQQLYYEDGTGWRKYIYKDNVDDYTKEELAHNKDLHKRKTEYGNFMRAERKVDGQLTDGEYHRYTQEFKNARAKVKYWVADGKYGYWKNKPSASEKEIAEFENKYMTEELVTFANFSDDQMNGTVQTPTPKMYPKRKYVEVKERAEVRKGNRTTVESMLDPQYEKIMNPDLNDPLAVAQKEFYTMYVNIFEKQLLKKLPSSTQSLMIGNSLLVRDNTISHLSRQPNVVKNLWSKAVGGAKDLFKRTQVTKKVITDEHGNFIDDTLPIFYIGLPQDEKALENIDDEIQLLNQKYQDKKIKVDQYKKELETLKGRRDAIQGAPAKGEMSLDLADNLLRFNAMAQNYETMSEIRNTVSAIMKVIENRKYRPSGVSRMFSTIKGKQQDVGMKPDDVNIVQRARKWMKMVYYDNNQQTKGFFDKVSDGLINVSSLTYIAFNVWGNINNYAMGRINNTIETIGGRYFEPAAMRRATMAFNAHLPNLVKRLGDSSTFAAVTGGKGKYKESEPLDKYNAIVGDKGLRMMDDMADIREAGQTKSKKSKVRELLSWGYALNDGAEYNVQSKVGMAIVMSTTVRNSQTGDEMSLYDAYQYNNVTGELTIKEGYDELIKFGERRTDPNDSTKKLGLKLSDPNTLRDLRNNIREVNKHIHGNYAYADRMVIQDHFLGKLVAQFHKWTVPGINARFRPEYYDENLGWVEGRYLSWVKFLAFWFKSAGSVQKTIKEMKFQYGDERADNKIKGALRTTAELGMVATTFITAMILDSLFDDDEEDKSIMRKRLENALIYQFNRQGRELVFFWPVLGFREQFQMAKSPVAVTRTLGEIGEALISTGHTGLALTYSQLDKNYDITKDSSIYYQRTWRKGQPKISKQWMDVIPFLYTINRWYAYDTQKDFFIK